MKKAILCGYLFDSTSHLAEKNKTIIIEDNIIIDIINSNQLSCISDCEVIDLTNSFVMPGLIDAHVHINMNGELDSDRLFLYQNTAEMTLNSIINVQSDLMAGFTTLRDVGSVHFTDVAVRNAINHGKYFGPRMIVCGWSISPPGGSSDSRCVQGIEGNHPHGKIVNGIPEILKAVRENFKYGANATKLMVTNAGGFMGMTSEEMLAAVTVSKSFKAKTCAHAHGEESIKNAVLAGVDSIEHGHDINEEVAELMKANNTFVVPTLMAVSSRNQRAHLKGLDKEGEYNLKKRIRETLDIYRFKGVRIGFGSDAAIPYISHGRQAVEFELMVEYGLTTAEALIASTRTNAELLGLDNQIGTIEVGKFADLTAYDKNPLDDIKAMSDCKFVMKNGVVYKYS